MKKIKRVISLIIVASLLSGCNSQKPHSVGSVDIEVSQSEKNENEQLHENDGVPVYYEIEPLSLSENAPRNDYSTTQFLDGRYYMTGVAFENTEDHSALCDVFYDGTMHSDESKLPEKSNYNINWYVKSDEIIKAAGISYDDMSIGECCLDDQKNSYVTLYSKSLSDKEIYLYKISPDNNIISETCLEGASGQPYSIFADQNGDITLLSIDENSSVISIYDGQTLELKYKFDSPDLIWKIFGQIGEYEITINKDDGFYGLDTDTNAEQLLVSYSDYYDIYVCDVIDSKAYFKVTKAKQFIYSENQDMSDGKQINIPNKIDLSSCKLYTSETGSLYIEALCKNNYRKVYKINDDEDMTEVCSITEYCEKIMYIDEKENIHTINDEYHCIYVYGADGSKSENNIELGSIVDFDCCVAQNKRVFFICYDIDGNNQVFELDENNMKLIDTKFIYTSSGDHPQLCNCSVPEYDFTYMQDNKIMGYSIDRKTSDVLIDLLINNIDMDINNLRYLGNYSFFSYGYTFSDSQERSYCNIKPMNKEKAGQMQNVKTISVAYLGSDISEVYYNYLKFNNNNNGYRVYVKNYLNDSDNISDAFERFDKDISAENIPDVIITGAENDMSRYINKGMIKDLYSFIDKDTEYGRDDFVAEILGAMEQDKKLYLISPSFDLVTLVGKESVVGESQYWSYDDFFRIVKNNPDMILSWWYEYEEMTRPYLSTYIEEYSGINNGKCDFNNDVFINLIKIFKEKEKQGLTTDGKYSNEYRDQFMDKKCIFSIFSDDRLQTKKFYEMQNEMSDKLIYKGYPSNQKINSLVYTNKNFYITNQSENADGAWEFIKSFFTEEYLCKKDKFNRMDGKYPIIKKTLNNYLEAVGDEISCDLEDETKKDEYIELTMNLIESKHFCYNRHNDILKIINDNLSKFYYSDQSAEDAAKTIENKVKLYLNELK